MIQFVKQLFVHHYIDWLPTFVCSIAEEEKTQCCDIFAHKSRKFIYKVADLSKDIVQPKIATQHTEDIEYIMILYERDSTLLGYE
jgi:hypothetical protein